MVKCLKFVFCLVFFAALALPSLHLFGVKEDWIKLGGYETRTKAVPFTFANVTNRTYQSTATEDYAKSFFLRKTFLTTAYELKDWLNFGLCHYGNSGSMINGRGAVLFERPYAKYHLGRDDHFDPKEYEKGIAKLREIDDFCQSIGADFVYLLMPDKFQTYPELMPPWFHWFWNYRNTDIQTKVAKLCNDEGIKAFDGLTFVTDLRKKTDKWLYPPGGAHMTPMCCGPMAEALVTMLNGKGRSHLKINRFLGVVPTNGVWSVDDDITLGLNTWHNSHLKTNVHYAPVYEQANMTMNAGGAVIMGDCFREQVVKIFQDARLFAPEKIVQSRRKDERAERYKDVIADLKLVVLVFQSFNSDRLSEQVNELDMNLKALQKARQTYVASGQRKKF